MRLILICLFFLSSGILNAQNGMLEGIIIDSETGQAMPYATVSIDINETLKGTVSDENGYFSFKKMPVGEYELTVQYLGYKKQVFRNGEIENEYSQNLLIELESDPVIIEEIIIEANLDGKIISCHCCRFSVLPERAEQIAKKNTLEENNERQNLKIYPNPSQGLIQLEIKEDLQEAFLSNAQGQKLIQLGNLKSGKQSIDLSPYPVGMYFVNYVYQDKVYAERVILIH